MMMKMVVRKDYLLIFLTEMNQVEYLKIPIEDKDSVSIADHFAKGYDFIEGAFNEQRTKQGG
jgi:hypothetical protein